MKWESIDRRVAAWLLIAASLARLASTFSEPFRRFVAPSLEHELLEDLASRVDSLEQASRS